jgi:nitrite reductase/ring-hydroxylating ferredoxin subunit
MFIHRHGGAVVVYANQCPHAGHPLDWTPGRFLDPTGEMFQCASHRARFRIEDGVCVAGPCPGRSLTPVKIEIEDGVIRAA